jgi:serine/threonine protein kinase
MHLAFLRGVIYIIRPEEALTNSMGGAMKEKRSDTHEWCLTGDKILDYEVIRCIRSSFKWTAYLAKDKKGNRVTLTYIDKEKVLERFRVLSHQSGLPKNKLEIDAHKHLQEYQDELQEAAARVKGLGSVHVAATIGSCYDRDRDELVIISEYVPGVDLFYASGRLKPAQIINLFSQALDGISFIHASGFLHLNLKPSRIMVDFEGDEPTVKLTDFGFAVPRQNFTGKYSGTLFYMAPEVIFEKQDAIDTRADLYSFGVSMYYCLTGHQPLGERFIAASSRKRLLEIVDKEKDVSIPPSKYNGDVPSELDDIVLSLLKKDPDARKFKTAASLLNHIYEIWPEESRHMTRESTSTLVTYD